MPWNSELVIKKLRECLQDIAELRARGPDFAKTPDFSTWRNEKVDKWLSEGGDAIRQQYIRFRQTRFRERNGFFPSDGPDPVTLKRLEEKTYQDALTTTDGLIKSAIENLELELTQEPLRATEDHAQQAAANAGGSTTIVNAGTAFVAGNQEVNYANVTGTKVFNALIAALEGQTANPEAKTIGQQIKDLARHPLLISLLTQGLPELLRHL